MIIPITMPVSMTSIWVPPGGDLAVTW
jgi:hypothetical protein